MILIAAGEVVERSRLCCKKNSWKTPSTPEPPPSWWRFKAGRHGPDPGDRHRLRHRAGELPTPLRHATSSSHAIDHKDWTFLAGARLFMAISPSAGWDVADPGAVVEKQNRINL
ncbi:MAG: hypothetical protein ACLU38_12335, partial [Dysosmobacter sp.]